MLAHEHNRYLRALGTTVWRSRDVLPGAKQQTQYRVCTLNVGNTDLEAYLLLIYPFDSSASTGGLQEKFIHNVAQALSKNPPYSTVLGNLDKLLTLPKEKLAGLVFLGDEIGGAISSDDRFLPLKAFTANSPVEMMEQPALKAVFWNALEKNGFV